MSGQLTQHVVAARRGGPWVARIDVRSVVRRIVPVQASGDRLELDLDLLSGVSGLNRMLGADSPLQPVTAPTEGGPIILNTERTEYRLK